MNEPIPDHRSVIVYDPWRESAARSPRSAAQTPPIGYDRWSDARHRKCLAAGVSCIVHAAILAVCLWPSNDQKLNLSAGDESSAYTQDSSGNEIVAITFIPPAEGPQTDRLADVGGEEWSGNNTEFLAETLITALGQWSETMMSDALTLDVDNVDKEKGPALDQYAAQIKARIERAWERPWARLDQTFHCRVEITQSVQGEVSQLKLGACDTDPRWQESILRAIRYAAPLPAPASETSFSAVIVLDFQAQPLSDALLTQLISSAQSTHHDSGLQSDAAPRDAARAVE